VGNSLTRWPIDIIYPSPSLFDWSSLIWRSAERTRVFPCMAERLYDDARWTTNSSWWHSLRRHYAFETSSTAILSSIVRHRIASQPRTGTLWCVSPISGLTTISRLENRIRCMQLMTSRSRNDVWGMAMWDDPRAMDRRITPANSDDRPTFVESYNSCK